MSLSESRDEGSQIRFRLRGLTVTELVVVIAIVAVLGTIAVPAYHFVAVRAKGAKCMGNLRQIGGALNLYLAEHHMTLPELVPLRADRDNDDPAIDNTLDAYLSGDPRVFACPADHKGLFLKTGTSYLWNSLLNGQKSFDLQFLGMDAGDAGIPVVSDKENFHRGIGHEVNILYADGHVDKELRFRDGN